MTSGKRSTSMLALLGAGALVLSACASNDGDEAEGSPTATAEQSASTEASPTAGESPSAESSSPSATESESADPSESSSADASDDAGSGDGAAATFGTEEPNLAEAWDVAEQKLKDAESVRIAGRSLDGSSSGEESSVDFQLAGTTDDAMSYGTIGMTTAGDAVEFDFRLVDGTTYLKVAAAEGGQMASMKEVLGERWLMDPDNSMGMEEFGVGTMIDQMVSGVASVDRAQMEAVEPEVSEQDGKQVFTYVEPGTPDTDGRDTAVSIDEDGYLTAVEVQDGGGSITFSNWNQVKPVTAPSGSSVLDINSMGG